MKKLFVLISLAFIVLVANAQTATIALADNNYITSAVDYSITAATVRNIIFDARGADWTTTQDFLVNIDSVAGYHSSMSIQLHGAKFATGAYSTIGSAVVYYGRNAGVSTDTTIILSNATATRWNFFKIAITPVGATGVSKIDAFEVKLYNQ